MSPELIRAHMIEAGRHHQAGRLVQARSLYQRILEADPRQPDALNLIGMVDYVEGRHARAVSLIRQAIAINPHIPGFHTNLATVLHAGGDSPAAAGALRQALRIKPDHLAALCNLGVVLQSMGDFGGAVGACVAALQCDPRLRDVWNTLGNCQVQLGQQDAALHSFGRAIQLDPAFPAARINAAGVLLRMGALDQAEEMCRALIRQHPGQAEAYNTLGLVLMERDRFSDAAAAFRAALAARPDYDDAALHLGNALFELGAPDGAIAQYRAIVARTPGHAGARLALAVAAIPMMPSSPAQSGQVAADFAQATAELDQWALARPGALARVVGTVQPFLLAYRPDDVTAPLAHFGRLVCREAACGLPTAAAITGRARVRLGIVSGQVRAHPVWQVILRGILAGLDRERFDIRLYHTGTRRDAETDWAERAVAHYQGQPRPVERWVDHIGHEAPDILFYPEVGMDPLAGALAPLRLAGLQVASWGHPVSTGMPSIDLYLSGDAIEPDDATAHYTERLIRLPGTGVSTQFGAPPASCWNGPQRQPGHVRFALCQQPMKFDPRDDALLARIAQAAGPCEFWVVQSRKHPWASALLMQRLATAFASAGLDPARYLRATPWMDPATFLGFLDAMDVMLDCPGFSGYTTAWQALHRGTPIVTREGRFMRQRLAAGLLRQIGRAEGIAGDAEQYVALAVELGDRSRREAARLRESLAAAAAGADGNVEAVAMLQRTLLDA